MPVPKLFCSKISSYCSCKAEDVKENVFKWTSDKNFSQFNSYVKDPAPVCVIVSWNQPTTARFGKVSQSQLLLIYKPNSTVVLNIHNRNAKTSQIKTKQKCENVSSNKGTTINSVFDLQPEKEKKKKTIFELVCAHQTY